MMEIALLASIISCNDGYWIIDGIEKSKMDQAHKSEMIITVRESMPENCSRSDYQGRR